jgi:hypothetical protein
MDRHELHEIAQIGVANISQLYLQLASECFIKAAVAERADAAEALTRMGRRYTAQASILDPSRSDRPSPIQ